MYENNYLKEVAKWIFIARLIQSEGGRLIIDLKIVVNYPPLRIKYFPTENTTMTMYLMYKNMVNNMEDKRLHKISANSSVNHLWLKQRLNH